MRIGCLQFAPVKGDVDNNLSRADGVLLKAKPEELDLLVLPELAFSGMPPCENHSVTLLHAVMS
jgi:protein N-terminal amidase